MIICVTEPSKGLLGVVDSPGVLSFLTFGLRKAMR